MSASKDGLNDIDCAQSKKCAKCGLRKCIDCFTRNRRKLDGLDVHCRDCVRERIRNKKTLHLANGKCVDCGGERGTGSSQTYCDGCLVTRASTNRSRQM